MNRTKTLGWLVGAAALLFAGCSSEDGVIAEETKTIEPQATVIHVTVGAGISDGEATTRSTVDVTTDGETGKKTRTLKFTGPVGDPGDEDFSTGDKLYVWRELAGDETKHLAGVLTMKDGSPTDGGTQASFEGDLTVYDGTGAPASYDFQGGNPLAGATATLLHAGMKETDEDGGDYSIDGATRALTFADATGVAATVEALMTKGLVVSGLYDAENDRFPLSATQPIVNCTISGLEAWNTYKVDYIYGATAAMDGGTRTLYSNVIPEEGGTLSFAFIAETGDMFHGIRLTNTWGDVYDVMEDVSLGQKSFTSKVYNATRTAVHVPQTINLSTATYRITARNGDVLTGTMSYGGYVRILDGATVTLSGVNISNTFTPIYCHANAVIVLEGDNTLTAKRTGIQTWADYSEGDAVPTLEIKGSGSLNVTAVGQGSFAAIGSTFYTSSSQSVSCGNITISGGTVTASAGDNTAAIGCGQNGKCGAITISGGTVTATAGDYAAAIGCGQNGKCGAITISGGTVTASNNSSEYAAIGGKSSGDGSDGSDCTSITITDGITSVAMRNSRTNGYLSSFAYAANINLNGFTLTAQQAKTMVPTGTFSGLRYSFDGSRQTWTLTKAN